MKKIIVGSLLSLFALTAFAQSEKYIKAMEPKVQALDSTRNEDSLRELANSFERIGAAEKNRWQPYYYAALATVNRGYQLMGPNMIGAADKIDPLADKAEQLLLLAEALSKDNSEIYIVKKMIASLRMMVDPMNRYMQYGPVAQQALETAKKLNPENPRVYLLEGQDKFYTPEQFGGSKAEAKLLFAQALQKFESFQPASPMDPVWGRRTTNYFIMLANK
jgi:hypothetical protein